MHLVFTPVVDINAIRGGILEVVRKIKKTPTPAPTPTPKRQKTGKVKTPPHPHPHQKPKKPQN